MANDERLWLIQCDETGEVNPQELAEAMMEVAGILRRVGGAVKMMARRRRVVDDPPLYLTERVDVLWTPHAPLPRRRRQEAPPPQVEDFDDAEAEAEAEAVEEDLERVAAGGG